jgi:hypothetical protein
MADSFDLLKKAKQGEKFEETPTKGEKVRSDLKDAIKEIKTREKKDKPKKLKGSKTDLTNTMKFSKGGRVAKGCGAVLPNRRKKTKYF